MGIEFDDETRRMFADMPTIGRVVRAVLFCHLSEARLCEAGRDLGAALTAWNKNKDHTPESVSKRAREHWNTICAKGFEEVNATLGLPADYVG